MPTRNARALRALAVLAALPVDALAQSSNNLPTINVEDTQPRRATSPARSGRQTRTGGPVRCSRAGGGRLRRPAQRRAA